ncbi:MAG: hypothetical protein QOI53_3138 [Verrucomicrobiota bacterium]|nr:hypothetical protein [Verrucomicrobiota bacterium]
MVLRPGGTYDSSPAIYRRVRENRACVPVGTPETAVRWAKRHFDRLSGTETNSKFQDRSICLPSGNIQDAYGRSPFYLAAVSGFVFALAPKG